MYADSRECYQDVLRDKLKLKYPDPEEDKESFYKEGGTFWGPQH